MQLSAAGLPLAVMSDGTAHAYSQTMAAWMRVADSAFPASPFHSMLQGPSGRDPPWHPALPLPLLLPHLAGLPRSAHCSRISGVTGLSLWRPTCASDGQMTRKTRQKKEVCSISCCTYCIWIPERNKSQQRMRS